MTAASLILKKRGRPGLGALLALVLAVPGLVAGLFLVMILIDSAAVELNVKHVERHRTHRVGWLRAAVLGANDGIVSTASLVLGVAAAGSNS